GQPQRWTHSGGHGGIPVPVTADGQIGDADVTDAAYVDAGLLSQSITPISAAADPENRFEGLLAAMWDFGLAGNGQPKQTAIVPIGTGMGGGAGLLLEVPVSPDPALNLLFGSHQESNWANALQSLNVSLEWR